MRTIFGLFGIFIVAFPLSHGIPTNSLEASSFAGLDEWSLLNIFDLLGLGELIAVSSVNPNFARIIADRYMIQKFRIHEKTVYIYGMGQESIINDRMITITSETLAQTFLENFGHLITHLMVSVFEKSAEIKQRIDQYCSKTLNEFTLLSPSHYFLGRTNHTFTKLKKLSYYYPDEGKFIPELSRIYPALEELSLTTTYTEGRKKYVNDVIEALPRLRAFSTNYVPSYRALQVLNERQPDLETLAITYPMEIFESQQKTIHFKNVKTLSLNILNDPVSSFPLRFNRLEKLTIGMVSAQNIPFDMISQCIGLKSLTLPDWGEMDDLLGVLSRFDNTHDIDDVSLYWSSRRGLESRTQSLLNDYPKLRKIELSVWDDHSDIPPHDQLLNIIRNNPEWQIDSVRRGAQFQQQFVTIKRRN